MGNNMNNGLRKYCPNCDKSKHEDEAAYCALCGTELKNEPKRELYLRLNVPDSKINIEDNREGAFIGCPFLLRKTDEISVQVVLFHDYPKCTHLIKNKRDPLSPESSEINMTDELLIGFLEKGFKWFHESDVDVLW